jgi:hypothetical protein
MAGLPSTPMGPSYWTERKSHSLPWKRDLHQICTKSYVYFPGVPLSAGNPPGRCFVAAAEFTSYPVSNSFPGNPLNIFSSQIAKFRRICPDDTIRK